MNAEDMLIMEEECATLTAQIQVALAEIEGTKKTTAVDVDKEVQKGLELPEKAGAKPQEPVAEITLSMSAEVAGPDPRD